jgi:uncharacterized protein (DUF433 family)
MAIIDGISTRYEVVGSGPLPLMSAPASMPLWRNGRRSPSTIVELSMPNNHVLRQNLKMTFSRITFDPAGCTGKPCIRGLRFPVARLLGLLASGESREQILSAYPYLESDDIDEALRYAAFLAR